MERRERRNRYGCLNLDSTALLQSPLNCMACCLCLSAGLILIIPTRKKSLFCQEQKCTHTHNDDQLSNSAPSNIIAFGAECKLTSPLFLLQNGVVYLRIVLHSPTLAPLHCPRPFNFSAPTNVYPNIVYRLYSSHRLCAL